MQFLTELHPCCLSCGNWQADPKIHLERQEAPNTQNNIEKYKLKGSHLLISKFTTKLQSSRQYGTHIKINIDLWNRILNQSINPYIYGQLIFDEGAKTIQWGIEDLSNKWCLENCISICKRKNLYSTSYNTPKLI